MGHAPPRDPPRRPPSDFEGVRYRKELIRKARRMRRARRWHQAKYVMTFLVGFTWAGAIMQTALGHGPGPTPEITTALSALLVVTWRLGRGRRSTPVPQPPEELFPQDPLHAGIGARIEPGDERYLWPCGPLGWPVPKPRLSATELALGDTVDDRNYAVSSMTLTAAMTGATAVPSLEHAAMTLYPGQSIWVRSDQSQTVLRIRQLVLMDSALEDGVHWLLVRNAGTSAVALPRSAIDPFKPRRGTPTPVAFETEDWER